MRKNGFLVIIFGLVICLKPGAAQETISDLSKLKAKTYADFSWPRSGKLAGGAFGTLAFSDPRSDPASITSLTIRHSVKWVYLPKESVPHIQVLKMIEPGISSYYGADATLLGYDKLRNAYVETFNERPHDGPAGHKICQVDLEGNVTVIQQVPSGLWKPGSGVPPPFPDNSNHNKPATAGMILGDDRTDTNLQDLQIYVGKVNWTIHRINTAADYGDDNSYQVRVLLLAPNGKVGALSASLKGWDPNKNAYVQIIPRQGAYDNAFFKIDPNGMPTQVDALPQKLSFPREAPAPQAAPPVIPKAKPVEGPVVSLPNGKVRITFVDPATNQQTSAEMERIVGSRDPSTPLEGHYHNEKYMVTIRGEEINVRPNSIPMGFKMPQRPIDSEN